MTLSEEERAHNHAAFNAMTLPQKAEYIFAYYKLPLVLVLVTIVSICSVARYYLTHKEPLLYVAYANVELPVEDDERIFGGFVRAQGANPRTTQVYRYYGLYLQDPEGSVDHQYSYASRLKLLAAIDAEELDVVLMSKSSYDLLSHSGYLADLQDVIGEVDSALLAKVKPRLVSNEVIVEDNQVELDLGEAESYQAETETHVNALDVSDFSAFGEVDLTDSIYLGIIGNSPREEVACQLVAYLAE